MCSTTSTGHFANLVQKTTGSCLKPARGSTVEPVKLSQHLRSSTDHGHGMNDVQAGGCTADSKDNIIQGNRKRDDIVLKMQSGDDPPHRENLLLQRVRAMEDLLNETFFTISTLKNAYIQLQAAHIPYDAGRLQMADRAVIKEMTRLSELKQYYKENYIAFELGNSYTENLAFELGMLSCTEEMSSKAEEPLQGDSEIENSKISSTKNGSLERNLVTRNTDATKHNQNNIINAPDRGIYSWKPNSGGSAHQYSAPTVKLFEATVHRMKESARGFTKCLIRLMRTAGWDLDAAVKSIEPGVRYAKHYHKKLAFQSYASMRMFEGFENENFYSTGSLMSSVVDPESHRKDCFSQFRHLQHADPMEVLSITPDCLFGKFCQKKFLHIVHPKMEESFFGNFEHRNRIADGGHPRSQFYGLFLRFAKRVWLVHRLAFSFDPPISIFHVKKGVDFHDSYMENLNIRARNVTVAGADEIAVEDCVETVVNPARFVGFTVMPGFRFGNRAVVRCQVYLTGPATPATTTEASVPN